MYVYLLQNTTGQLLQNRSMEGPPPGDVRMTSSGEPNSSQVIHLSTCLNIYLWTFRYEICPLFPSICKWQVKLLLLLLYLCVFGVCLFLYLFFSSWESAGFLPIYFSHHPDYHTTYRKTTKVSIFEQRPATHRIHINHYQLVRENVILCCAQEEISNVD